MSDTTVEQNQTPPAEPVVVTPAPEKPAKKPAPQLVEVTINRDFWDEHGIRQEAGNIISVTVEAALEGIESGALSRIKRGDK